MHVSIKMSGIGMVRGTSTLSMREKSHLKRRINREHNCNFRAGYIEVNEEYLHKTGIRGRKRYLLYCVIASLILLTLLNALVTAGLVYFLGISHLGIDNLEFLPSRELLRIFGETEVNKIKMFDARIGGRHARDLKIVGMEGAIVIQAPYENGTRVVLYDNKISMTTDNFQVTSNKNGEVFLSTSLKSIYPLKQSKNLHAAAVQAKTVRSRSEYPDLDIESYSAIKILGAEGVDINSQQGIALAPERHVKLNSTSGSVSLEPRQALYLNNQLPVSTSKQTLQPLFNQSDAVSQQNIIDLNNTIQSQPSRKINQSKQAYKLCICISTGKLFAVKVTDDTIGCRNIEADLDPCY